MTNGDLDVIGFYWMIVRLVLSLIALLKFAGAWSRDDVKGMVGWGVSFLALTQRPL